MRRGAFMRGVHRLHRTAGTLLALLLATWFASGAVMTFSAYPRYAESLRLAQAPPLPRDAASELPPELERWLAAGELARGSRARLSVLEGRAVWTFSDRAAGRRALDASPLAAARSKLDGTRARREVERRFGTPVREAELVEDPDQWTVGRVPAEMYPLFRVALTDTSHSEVYVSARSGEVVQASTRAERAWCWVGAIPHWIYPTILRREREVWRTTVLVLSGAGLVLTVSGLVAGLHAAWITRKRADRGPRNVYLRWHQRVGVAFGLFATTWLFSGALSLAPFRWSGDGPSEAELERVYGWDAAATSDLRNVGRALARCQERLMVRELELAAFAGSAAALCSASSAERLIVDLADPELTPRSALPRERLARLVRRAAGRHAATTEWRTTPDDYYYPTHDEPDYAADYVRVAIADPAGTTLYLDPSRARLVHHTTRAKRLERWLYHGLHSLDVAFLYERPMLWRSAVIAAMSVGFALSCLGFAITVSRARKRRR